jgi:BolA protein
MSLQDTIETKLRSNFNIVEMNVINESHLHAEDFDGQSRVHRHRSINALLKPELDAGLHALALDLAAPGEAKRW